MSLSNLRIAIIMPLAEQRGGGELMLLDLMQHGRDAGVTWLVIFMEDGPMRTQIEGYGVETRLVPSGRLREPHKFVGAIREIAQIARSWQASALLGWMGKSNLYGGPASALAGIPCFWYQLSVPVDKNWIDRIANALPTRAVLTLSKAAQVAQSEFWPRRPVSLVYPGVGLDRFDPSRLPAPVEVRERLALPEPYRVGPLIGIVGRLQRWKGMHVLIDAMPSILAQQPDAHALIVGGKHDMEPDYEPFLQERIRTLGLEERVLMTGLQRNVPEWMQAMDVVIHASDNEPFGIVVIEAMALGKPVVAGAEGGPQEIITEGKDGLLAPYGDAAQLSAAILRYLNTPDFADQTGAAARLKALTFSTENYAHNCIQALRQYLG